MTVTKITEVHIHDASNYVREALEDTGRKISTNVRPGWFDITARHRGTLYAHGISIATNDDGSIPTRRLEAAVWALRDQVIRLDKGLADDAFTPTPGTFKKLTQA